MPTTPGSIEPNDIVGMACTTLVMVRADAGAVGGAGWAAPHDTSISIAVMLSAAKHPLTRRSGSGFFAFGSE